MSHKPPSVGNLIHRSMSLRALADEAGVQQTLLSELRRHLPDMLAGHCSAARLRDQQLIVSVDSPAWATRLRFVAPQLLDSLRQRYPDLEAVRVKVAVTHQCSEQTRRRTARRSAAGARIIHEYALETSETPLREALMRLSRALDSSQG